MVNFATETLVNFDRNLQKQLIIAFNYKKKGKTLEIYNDHLSKQDSVELINNGLTQFLKKLVLTIERKAFTDSSSNLVYVLYNDFKKKCYLTYFIDNKIYKQETGLPDAYGIIRNHPKTNKELQLKIDSMRNEVDNYIVHVYKGL